MSRRRAYQLRTRMQLFEGCTNLAKKGKECIYLTRGAKVQGGTVQALEGVYRPSQEMGGVCVTHGEQRLSDEVFMVFIKGGVCIIHGAKVKRCSRGEVYYRLCQKGWGLHITHGATMELKRCSHNNLR